MEGAINTFIDIFNTKNPFGIQKRCPLYKMINITESTFNIKINRITIKSNAFTEERELDITKLDKYLIEYHGINHGDTIKIHTNNSFTGVNINSHEIQDNNLNININLLHINLTEDNIYKQFNILVSNNAPIGSIIDIAKQNFNVLPNTIKLFYCPDYQNSNIDVSNIIELNNITKLVKDYNIKNQDVILVIGKYFPIDLLPGYSFLENNNIKISKECIICLEEFAFKDDKIPKIMKCGHLNTCIECYKKYNKDICPICK